MPLTAKQRRALVAESHRLKASVTVTAGALSETVVEHVRAGLVARGLLKIRIHAERGVECDAAAAELGRRIPCEVVRRVGRVVLLCSREAGQQPNDAGNRT